MKQPIATLTIATVIALAVGVGSVAAQAPTQATGAEPGPAWSWEAAVGPVLLIPAGSLNPVTGVELYAARYWASGPVRTGVELSAMRVPGENGGRVTLGLVKQRPATDGLDFTAHLGVGALWHRGVKVIYPGFGFAPCHPELGCPSGGRSSDRIVIPAAYAGAGLGLAVTERVLLRGGGRVTLARGEDGLVTLFELPVAFVVRF